MKQLLLAALTALNLGAGVANAQGLARDMVPTVHQNPYDNTINSLGGRTAGTYGGD